MAMKQDTPYRTRPVGERARELACVSEILEHATPAFRIYEAFGGIGMLGKLLSERFPTALIDSYELDEECVGQYRSRGLGNVTITHGDTRSKFANSRWSYLDAASLDFNRFTLLDLHRKEGEFQRWVLSKVFSQEPDWVHVTDSSCSKLHLNYRSYHLDSPSWEDYAKALNAEFRERWGYRVLTHSNHSRAAYFLLVPVSP